MEIEPPKSRSLLPSISIPKSLRKLGRRRRSRSKMEKPGKIKRKKTKRKVKKLINF